MKLLGLIYSLYFMLKNNSDLILNGKLYLPFVISCMFIARPNWSWFWVNITSVSRELCFGGVVYLYCLFCVKIACQRPTGHEMRTS